MIARRLLLLTLASLLSVETLFAQGYLFFTGGGSGAAHAGSFGGEGGKLFPHENPRYLLGGSLGVVFNAPNPVTSIPGLEIDIRHEQELHVVGGIRVLRRTYIVGSAGGSFVSEKDYAIVNGKRVFLAEVPVTNRFSSSGQLRFVLRRVILGVGYHSRRGVMGGMGFTF